MWAWPTPANMDDYMITYYIVVYIIVDMPAIRDGTTQTSL